MLNAGRYYVGDPSVVLTPQEVKHLEQFKDGYCSMKDQTTAWFCRIPKGIYRTSVGNTLSISEVGMIIVHPMSPKWNSSLHTRNINLFGMNTMFNEKFHCVKLKSNDLQIDTIIVDTSNDGVFGDPIDQNIPKLQAVNQI